MGTVIMPDLYLWFGEGEVLVVDTFGNIVKVFGSDADGEAVIKANRFIDEQRNKWRWRKEV